MMTKAYFGACGVISIVSGVIGGLWCLWLAKNC